MFFIFSPGKLGKLVVSKRSFNFYSYLLREMIQFGYMIFFINVWPNHQVDEFIPKSHGRFTKWIPGRGDSGFGHHPGGEILEFIRKSP